MFTDAEKRDLKQRLKKVAGQINGIDRMLDDDRYCIDMVQQILAARAALNRVALMMLEGHAKSCMVKAIREDNADHSISELMDVVKQLTK